MKKAKIMLMAISVLTVVGGALAFKATKQDERICLTTSTISDICAVAEVNWDGFIPVKTTTDLPAECEGQPRCTVATDVDFEG